MSIQPFSMDIDQYKKPDGSQLLQESEYDLNASQYNVGYVWDPRMLAHQNMNRLHYQDDHPEQPERISEIYRVLQQERCLQKMVKIPIRQAVANEVLLVHSEDLWDKVICIQSMNQQDIEDSYSYYDLLSLYVCPQTTDAALLSCGGTIEACMAVATGKVKKAFAIVRPPGHHAEPDEHMGFCFFNNVSVAARVVQQKTAIQKILIVDWDVHHGNGTQHAFNHDPNVLYISLHRYDGGDFYPNGPFGNLDSCGEGAGRGFSVNIPWPCPGMGDADYLHAFQSIVMPIAMEFAPELVIISAGFDAAHGDMLGECHVTPAGYAHMTHMLIGLAGGRVAVALEGGYSLEAVAASSLAVTQILLGEAPPRLESMTASAEGTETVYQVARFQSQFWKCLNHGPLEPKESLEPLAVSIPEILMAYRQNTFSQYQNMNRIPLQPAIADVLSAEVWCTSDLWKNDTMVVLVHEFGELRGELASALTCDLDLEKSYLIDFTKELVNWITSKGYSLVDINLIEKQTPRRPPASIPQDELKRGLVTYIWDNYIHLSEAKKIVLIGHGAGCQPITELLSKRAASVMGAVQKVIQVAPRSTIPRAPADPPKLRTWYSKNSLVIVPSTHTLLLAGQLKPSHGGIKPINEDKPILLMAKALPLIKGTTEALFESEQII